jgi:hypothetical protein
MKPHFVIFLFLTHQLSGQLKENFENSEISKWHESVTNRWKISSERPISGSYSLHHVYDNDIPDHDQISLLHDPLFLDTAMTTWSFKIRHEYDPSAYNHWAVFLASDKNATGMQPDETCNGYILGVNYTGSDDCIKFWKSVNYNISEITNTGFNWQNEIGKDKPAALEVIRYQSGRWEFYIDTTFDNSFKTRIGEAEDSELKISQFFGLYYKYSSGQDRKLWFDDLLIDGFFMKDTLPPRLTAARCPGQLQLVLQFDEPVILLSDSKLEIKVSSKTRNIDSMKVADNDLYIWIDEPVSNESEISVEACHIRDNYGNTNDCDSIVFFNYLPGFNDLIITELMADPFPPVNLPEAEYLELYNRCKYSIQLGGWQICAGSDCATFDTVIIHPGKYMILYDSRYSDLFSRLSGKLPMNGFPRISNTGQTIVLKDSRNNIVFSTEYHTGWYRDNDKSVGGWSLEMIDSDNPCGGKENWKASIDVNGGTPGYINSVAGYNPDNDNPGLLRSVIISDSVLYLHFSEPIAGKDLFSNNTYLVNNHIGMPYMSNPASNLLSSVFLYFDNRFEENSYYSLLIKNNLADCAGNLMEKNTKLTFRKPMDCDSLDLIINEILFDPRVPEGEFIEIYNNSMKTIDLKDFYIVLKDTYTGKQGLSYILSESPCTIEPGDYLALTGNISLITGNYRFLTVHDFLEMKNFPNLPNAGTIISLVNANDQIIDEVAYSPDMHIEIANNTKGVSLERIDPEGQSNYPGNWFSAAGASGYATPGFENSQYKKDKLLSFSVAAEPEIITPDGDGMNDVTVIRYVLGQAGFFANILIFDRTGRPVKIIARNMLLGLAGEFVWDGKTSEGRMAPIGPYLIYTEIYNLSGSIRKFKNSCIIAEKIY